MILSYINLEFVIYFTTIKIKREQITSNKKSNQSTIIHRNLKHLYLFSKRIARIDTTDGSFYQKGMLLFEVRCTGQLSAVYTAMGR